MKKICKIDGCDSPYHSMDLCKHHYLKNYRYGTPTPEGIYRGMRQKSDTDRFHEKYIPEVNTGCWLWCAGTFRDGYGKIRINGKFLKAHRYSYEIHYGEFDKTKNICHKCDVKPCVNPQHLFMGTPLDNTRDKIKKGRARYHRGEECHTARLAEYEVKEIRDYYKSGISSKFLAQKYRITKGHVWGIVTRKRWKHV